MSEPLVRYPTVVMITSSVETCTGIFGLACNALNALLAYKVEGYRQLLAAYWSSEKSAETLLDLTNCLILLAAGKKGKAVARQQVGEELNTFFTDFLTWNTMGAIVSALQFIFLAVEIIFLTEEQTKMTGIRWLTALPLMKTTMVLLIQCFAVCLDMIPWWELPPVRKVWKVVKMYLQRDQEVDVPPFSRRRRRNGFCRIDTLISKAPTTAQTSVRSETFVDQKL
ncbi:hypothetical protein RvY_01259 [Ramazzottius varieornatus]|uniref:Uncharacterized protein n=1 Tax=Ramazzottius varieornatus TaxID=947166 RepID=A0A1D1UJM4_RAMVA|nr:hypothetical protein RvY_01259 [Ramazzottius varieornatus]